MGQAIDNLVIYLTDVHFLCDDKIIEAGTVICMHALQLRGGQRNVIEPTNYTKLSKKITR
jgi:hypothetical protein